MTFDILFFIFNIITPFTLAHSKKPIITHGVTETFGYANQPTSLQCRVSSDNIVNVDWYRNDSKIFETLEHHITKLKENVFISEISFLISDGTVGAYYCNASNEYGWAVSSPASVFIAFMEDDFLIEPQSKVVSFGETVILSCEPPNGSPKPTVLWYKDEKEVHLSSHIQVLDETNLRIEQISWDDAGAYSCVAKSLAFEKSSKIAHLRVCQRPYFLVAPQSQTIPVNSIAEFVCRVSGNPLPTLTWRRDPPVPAISTTRSVLLADGSLKLANVQLEDAGDYVCQAINDGGVVEAVARLSVTSPPGFVETPPGSAVFLEGTRAQLICLVTGLPIPEIRWINQKTSEYYLLHIKSSSHRITVTETGSLIINTVRISDSGTYECRASSSAGFARTVIHLFIQPNPHLFPGRIGVTTKSPVYISHSQNMNELKLVCLTPSLSEFYEYMASGMRNTTEIGNFNPLTTFKTYWYKEKKEIALFVSSSDRFRSDVQNSLIIKPIHHNDVGNYSCMVLGLMNKRIAFWQIQVAQDSLNDRFGKLYSDPVFPPSNVTSLSVGDTWVSLSWEYNYARESDSDVRFNVFYLLQFFNSTYISNRRFQTFDSGRISEDASRQDNEIPVDSGTVDDGQYPLDVWVSAAESTRETHFHLTGLLPDSGYWIEVRATNSLLWSRGALINHIVYTAQSTPKVQLDKSDPLEPGRVAKDFQDLSARVHSLRFLGVRARSLSASEIFISWTMQTANFAVEILDGFQIVAKPVFMSRCSARATSVAMDLAYPVQFGVTHDSRFEHDNVVPLTTDQAHCSFNSEQLIGRFRQASINAAQISNKSMVPEKILIVSRTISRESPNTGAVMGGLHPFTCYEITVKAFKDDQTYGRFWSMETPAELVLSLDALPSEAPQLIAADWLHGTTTFHSPASFSNFSHYSNNYPITPFGIRLKWIPLELYFAHGTLIGYSIHLLANDSRYTQSQKVSPDVNTHDLIGLNPDVEYTIFLAGITCRGEGVRGPGYRMPVFGDTLRSLSPSSEFSSKVASFPMWAYGVVSGILVAWMLIGCLSVVCLRRRKSQGSQGYCCFGAPSVIKIIKHEETVFNMSSRKASSSPVSPINTSESKLSHTVSTTTESQDHHSVVLLQRKASRKRSGGNECQRLLRGAENSGESVVSKINSSSASTSTNTTNNLDCYKDHCLPLTVSVPYPPSAGGFQSSAPSGAYMISSFPNFLPKNAGRHILHCDTQWNDSQLHNSAEGRNNALPDVNSYASSNVLPLEANQSARNPEPKVDHTVSGNPSMPAGVGHPTWVNCLPRPQLKASINGHAVMSVIPPPPPYPPPPLPEGSEVVVPPYPTPLVPSHSTPATSGSTQEALRHLSDDGSGGSYLSGYCTHEGCHTHHSSPYSLKYQHQQFYFPPDTRQANSERSATAGGGTSGGSSSHSSHHMRSPMLTRQPLHQPLAAFAPLQPQTHPQQQRGGPRVSARSSGHSMVTSNSPPLVGHHSYMADGTASSNESATSMPPNFPPSARDIRLMQAGQLGLKSTSHCCGHSFPPQIPAPFYHTPEPIFVQPKLGLADSHYDQPSSVGDNMTYSEVNSTTDMRNVNNEEEKEDTDFNDSHSCSTHGQMSPRNKLNLSRPLVRN